MENLDNKNSVKYEKNSVKYEKNSVKYEKNNYFTEMINGDCFFEMKNIKSNSIDLILTDPPYNITKNIWDKKIPIDLLWLEYNRIIKDKGVIIIFSNQPFTSHLIIGNPTNFRYTLVWEKNKFSDFLNCNKKILKIHEDICIFYKKTPITYNPQFTFKEPYVRSNKQENIDKQTNYNKYNEKKIIESKDGKRYPTSVLKYDRVERPIHPTQKPNNLLEYLIKTFSNEGDIILDSFAGVGTTLIASLNTKRNCIGIEIEKKYYEKYCDLMKTYNI